MRRPTAALVLLLDLCFAAVGCAATRSAPPGTEARVADRTTALAVDSALTAMGASPLWPGFAPLATPLALFDGERTYLFRHPAPPAGYSAVPGRSDAVVREGRDPAVTANSSALLGGVPTATVILDTRSGTQQAAALTVHELFHVFQRAKHPSWQGNEADLFTYPVEDSAALALRREETFALARAVGARTDDSLRCWAGAALDARRRRFALVGAAAAAYERGTELNEGLAQYVERRAAGTTSALDAVDLPPAQVRQRSYVVGAALAGVLDRVRPGWRDLLEHDPDGATLPLDSLLAGSLSGTPSRPCSVEPTQRARWAVGAGNDVRALLAERTRTLDEYLGRGGWRVIVDARTAPFFPGGFDPLNVVRLSETEILHTRFLKLRGQLGSIDVLSARALTEGGAGAHPLFAGVRRVTLAGLTSLTVHDSAGTLAVDASGVTVRLHGTRADTTDRTILIHPR